jgi:hypothetical protein
VNEEKREIDVRKRITQNQVERLGCRHTEFGL